MFTRRHFCSAVGLTSGVAAAGRKDTPAQAETSFPDFKQSDAGESRRGVKSVFAHWHVFPISTDNKNGLYDYYSRHLANGVPATDESALAILDRPIPRPAIESLDWRIIDMRQDIDWAIQGGLDGFILNLVTVDQGSVHWLTAVSLLKAADERQSVFCIALSIDASSSIRLEPISKIVDALVSIFSHKSIARRGGRIVLSSFSPERWQDQRWADLLAQLEARGFSIFFLPVFLKFPESDASFIVKRSDAISRWSGNSLASLTDLEENQRFVEERGGIWAAPIWFQDCRAGPKIYWEAHNSATFREGWRRAIEGRVDIVIINTWNDYSEGSHIRPSLRLGSSILVLSAFFSSWFKAGTRPTIHRDLLVYFYRQQQSSRVLPSGRQIAETEYVNMVPDDFSDDVELIGLMRESGSLQILRERGSFQLDAKEGLNALTASVVPGSPSFAASRGNYTKTVVIGSVIRPWGRFDDPLYCGGWEVVLLSP